MTRLNLRHKVGLFLTTIIVGVGLLLDVSAKESVGIAMLGLAATWVLGSLRLRKQESSDHGRQQAAVVSSVVVAPEQLTAPSERRGAELGQSVVSTKSRGSWAGVIISALSFSVLLGLAIFNLTWHSFVVEDEKAGQWIGGMLIPLILLGYATKSAWKSLLAKEPESNPVYQLRYRKFNLIGGICAIGILFSAVGLGIITGQRIQRNRKLDSTVAEMERLGPKSEEIRTRIKSLLSEATPTFEDYYFRCLRLEEVLDDYDRQEQRVKPLLNAILADAAEQPKLVEIARTALHINDKDAEVVRLFRLEIVKGKELVGLPVSRQTGFYRKEIVPLEREAARVAEEEIVMMREAEQKGIKWPTDVKELIK